MEPLALTIEIVDLALEARHTGRELDYRLEAMRLLKRFRLVPAAEDELVERIRREVAATAAEVRRA